MKKLSVLSTLSLSAVLLMSCSLKRSQPVNQAKNDDMAALMETVEVKNTDVLAAKPKSGEYTHEIAEATADDVQIKQAAGTVVDIDEELPGSQSDEIPYSRDFLIQKNTKRMEFWVDYFTNRQRDRFQRFINNGEEYRHHIESIFMEYGLPKELYFVGLIESGFYLGARSHASAVGPWQFIKGTGKRYGLSITSEIDERQDLFKATHSAAQYFKDLHNIFSSWELALAAYNAGENGIIRRIMKHGTRDFYQLSRKKLLPEETINYVPKVLAAMHVVNNAEKYGFVLPKKEHRLFDLTHLVPVKKGTSLASVAQRMNVDLAILKKLNPELKRNMTPRHFAGTYHLRVPKSAYSYNLDDHPSRDIASSSNSGRVSRPESRKELTKRTASTNRDPREPRPRFHQVRRGETLLSISRKYHVTPRSLADANNFKSWKTRVQVGQRIALVNEEEQVVTTRLASPKVKLTNRPIVYKVTRGDNLSDIAKLFNTPISKIKRANNLKSRSVVVGQKIILPNTQKAIYTVRPGDHLTKVAKDFNLPIETLVKVNSLKRRTIYPGQKIIVNMD